VGGVSHIDSSPHIGKKEKHLHGNPDSLKPDNFSMEGQPFTHRPTSQFRKKEDGSINR
jgi:hypothetical protein